MMVVAEHARHLPGAGLVLPQVNKTGLARSIGLFGLGMDKPVHPHLDRTVALHKIDPQRTGHEHALGVARADIVLYALGQSGVSARYSALVVIKLHVIGKQAVELL